MTTLALVAPPDLIGTVPNNSPRALEVLGRLDALRHDLEQPDLRVADVVSISRQADVLHHAARAARLGLATANAAAETKLRAERKAGTLLRQLMADAGPSTTRRSRANNPGRTSIAGPRARESLPPHTLKTLNISPKDSSTWQLISQLPEREFEQRISAIKAAHRQLHSGTFVRAARQFTRPVAGRPTTPTASLLRRVLLLLRDVPKRIATPVEQDLARQVVGVVEDWDLVEPLVASNSYTATAWVREISCVLCARPKPASNPPKCPSCGGAWVV